MLKVLRLSTNEPVGGWCWTLAVAHGCSEDTAGGTEYSLHDVPCTACKMVTTTGKVLERQERPSRLPLAASLQRQKQYRARRDLVGLQARAVKDTAGQSLHGAHTVLNLRNDDLGQLRETSWQQATCVRGKFLSFNLRILRRHGTGNSFSRATAGQPRYLI